MVKVLDVKIGRFLFSFHQTIFFVRFRTGFKVAFFRRLRLKNREKGVVAKLLRFFFFFFFFLVSFFKEVLWEQRFVKKKKPSVSVPFIFPVFQFVFFCFRPKKVYHRWMRCDRAASVWFGLVCPAISPTTVQSLVCMAFSCIKEYAVIRYWLYCTV